MLFSGFGNYEPGKDFMGRSYSDRDIVIKADDSVIWKGKRGDIKKALESPVFREVYQIWRMHHYGTLREIEGEWLSGVITSMEEHHHVHFSHSSAIIKYLDALFKRGK